MNICECVREIKFGLIILINKNRWLLYAIMNHEYLVRYPEGHVYKDMEIKTMVVSLFTKEFGNL